MSSHSARPLSGNTRSETFRRRIRGTQPLSRLGGASNIVSTFSVACKFATPQPLRNVTPIRKFWLPRSNLTYAKVCISYAVFCADWGEGEHVFSPARRWVDRQKQSLFTLSPEEQRMMANDSSQSKAPLTTAQSK
ncbi:uncharacterized protein EI90DRAFT_3037733 [Cantharellus anzutake]|uniref:uncharacterized protein n=1 Tax=Cantharellus anzutake TaxID=1750568 RepID=UPI001905B446|nr:uncharacterized protein EI90DRAFT_3037733 [Cantharellus anzutake]KAF8339781.1 hypothetical protein EI90DRAFT_3037733 [Cantharellus anzutake]